MISNTHAWFLFSTILSTAECNNQAVQLAEIPINHIPPQEGVHVLWAKSIIWGEINYLGAELIIWGRNQLFGAESIIWGRNQIFGGRISYLEQNQLFRGRYSYLGAKSLILANFHPYFIDSIFNL